MIAPVYIYRATLVRVLDGDTFELLVDLGFGIHARKAIRLRGVFAPERDAPGGAAATAEARARLETATVIILQTQKTKVGHDVTSFARYVADVWADGIPLASQLTFPPGGIGLE